MLNGIGPGGVAHDDVAELAAKGVRDEAGSLREPIIAQRNLQLVRQDFGDPVLEALPLPVRERHVVRVGADPKHVAGDDVRDLLGSAAVRLNERETGGKERDPNLGR